VFPWDSEWHGRLEKRTFESDALRSNPLGDPHVRPVYVYMPPEYDNEQERRYPSVYVIQGLTGQVDMWLARERWGARNFPELADELFASGEVPPCIVVFVDAWTRYGGSQYVDSPAVGRYHTYLCDELVLWVDREYRTLAAPEHRGIQGKSSGGYGAQITPMLRPDLFGAFASHAGDALFEYCFLPEFPAAARALTREYEGSPAAFWDDFWSRRPHGKPSDVALVGVLSMAACYSPNDDGTYELPFELPTGRLREDVWGRWLAWDPVRMAPRHAEALRGLRGVYLDGGTRDEFFLDLGALAMREALADLGVEARLELFEGGHSGIDYRYPIGLRFLAEHLAPHA
jgi:S-formylglutathione hydrolase FrmB